MRRSCFSVEKIVAVLKQMQKENARFWKLVADPIHVVAFNNRGWRVQCQLQSRPSALCANAKKVARCAGDSGARISVCKASTTGWHSVSNCSPAGVR